MVSGACPGISIMAIRTQPLIMVGWHTVAIRTQPLKMVGWHTVAIRTDIHTGMIKINFQPGVGNMAAAARSWIMIYRTGVTVAAIT